MMKYYAFSIIALCLVLVAVPTSTNAQMLGKKNNPDWHKQVGVDKYERIEVPEEEIEEEDDDDDTRSTRKNSRRSTNRAIRDLGDDPVEELKIPIPFGITARDIWDSWGDPRSGGRKHEGNDILAPKGTYIVSPTKAVVAKIGRGTLGGNYVYTHNPGGERFYYAHLDRAAEGLRVGDKLNPGDLIGYVGNTGNAEHGPDHLHLGIYTPRAINPYDRLVKEFTTQERIGIFEDYLGRYDNSLHRIQYAKWAVETYPSVFVKAQRENIAMNPLFRTTVAIAPPKPVVEENPVIDVPENAAVPLIDLRFGDDSVAVAYLQAALIRQDSGPATDRLARAGTTGYFGSITQNALMEYQESLKIPTHGVYDQLTRSYLYHHGR